MYQKCQTIHHTNDPEFQPDDHCGAYARKHGYTGEYSCPTNYTSVLITSSLIELKRTTETRQYEDDCDDCFLFFFDCDCDEYTVTYTLVAQVQVESYWCRLDEDAEAPEGTGEMFGGRVARTGMPEVFETLGLYRSGDVNPFTGRVGCPGTYQPYALAPDTTVCLSRDYELDYKYAVDFAGFFSCQTPEANRTCETGYSQHWVTSAEVKIYLTGNGPAKLRNRHKPTVRSFGNKTGSKANVFPFWLSAPVRLCMIMKLASTLDLRAVDRFVMSHHVLESTL